MEYSSTHSEIIYSVQPEVDIESIIRQYQPGKVFVVTEENVFKLWFDKLPKLKTLPCVVIPSGEDNKGLGSVELIWEFLSSKGADRKSLLINVGGGMLTDLGGFAASTFKRGVDFINVPTTLLAQVDASVGGKTGINFRGLKNEIGTFNVPRSVIISSTFLQTLDQQNLLSGFAEMVKHGLIYSSEHFLELCNVDFENLDLKSFQEIIRHSVQVKEYFVQQDPTEKNIRKALNFGHTIGHALESLFLEQHRPVLHGYAVAWGMMAELYLSQAVCGLDPESSVDICDWISSMYGKISITSEDFEELYMLMGHDKKNEAGRINFTLISSPGNFEINQESSKELIFEALRFLQNSLSHENA
ncbi:MAG TPA: 3-dehydroquinate synthase [Prolixibacteraceae bacterium]|nr:3-dehydroquinate synthase [Prolixibacteraceae bacterium]